MVYYHDSPIIDTIDLGELEFSSHEDGVITMYYAYMDVECVLTKEKYIKLKEFIESKQKNEK